MVYITARLRDKGQIVLPKKIRDKAKVMTGSIFTVDFKNGQIVLRLLASPDRMKKI